MGCAIYLPGLIAHSVYELLIEVSVDGLGSLFHDSDLMVDIPEVEVTSEV